MASQQSDRFSDLPGSILRIAGTALFRRHCSAPAQAPLVTKAMVSENVADLQTAWLTGMSYPGRPQATPFDATVLRFPLLRLGNRRLQMSDRDDADGRN
jgi:hypothetical protein